MFSFDDATLVRLFGEDAAENDPPERFKEYFFRNRAYDSVRASLPVRILVGHKGTGKSALLRRAYLEDIESHTLALWLRPNEVMAAAPNAPSNFLPQIEQWKTGLEYLIGTHTVSFLTSDADGESILGAGAQDLLSRLPNLISEKVRKIATPTASLFIERYNRDRSITIYLDDLDRGWEAKAGDIRNISALLNAIRDLSTRH
jgi:hypothetical protein